jgi:lysophospholipase L1-like esterase
MTISFMTLFSALMGSIAAGQTKAAGNTNAAPSQRRPLPESADPKLPTLFLIGDSTVRNGQGDGANGQWGWGEPIVGFFDTTKINVVNRAGGGLSSRTYLTGGNWDQPLAMLKPGDFVMMQFGHNDSSAINDDSRARGTIKGTGDETEEIDNLCGSQRHHRPQVRRSRAGKGGTPVCRREYAHHAGRR